MRRRSKMSRKKSRKLFSKTSQYVNVKNIHRAPMRGGIRL